MKKQKRSLPPTASLVNSSTCPDEPKGLTTLPPALAHGILLSAMCAHSMSAVLLENEQVPKHFRLFAAVSKAWSALSRDAASAIALTIFVAPLPRPKRKELLELRRQLTLRRVHLKTLELERMLPTGDIKMDQWAALFSQTPRLEELSLKKLDNVPNKNLGPIVRAAGQQCRALRALVTHAPYRNGGDVFYPAEETRLQLTKPMYELVEQVWKNSGQVGLRRLCVSMRFDHQKNEQTRNYLNKVIECCPNIEQFDGFRAAVGNLDVMTCFEQWRVDVELWTRFCTTLNNLTEFDWVCIPFATVLFEIFGQHRKPKLQKLLISAAMNFDWPDYTQDLDLKTLQLLEEKGLGGTAKNVHSILRACPDLRDLRVTWFNPVTQDDIARLGYSRVVDSPTTLMNPEVFGDEFWEAAARLCPQLTSVALAPANIRLAGNKPIVSFTDRSMRAIAALPGLTDVELDTVNITGKGLFALSVHHQPATRKKRFFTIIVGDQREESNDRSIDDVLTGFLKELIDADAPLPCANRLLLSTVCNRRNSAVDHDWSEKYFEQLKDLLHAADEKHPDVSVDVVTNGFDGTGFSQLIQFTFQTNASLERFWREQHDKIVGNNIWERPMPLHEDFGAFARPTHSSSEDDGNHDDDESDEGSFWESSPDDGVAEDYSEGETTTGEVGAGMEMFVETDSDDEIEANTISDASRT